MNISYSWLKKYVDFDMSPEEIGKVLTSIGLEVGGIEEYESVKGGLRGLAIGKVLTCHEHTNSDHLHVTTVDLGAEISAEPLQIVCGAPNIAAGQTVVVATEGTTLYSGEESFKIKKSKIRGEESRGMICSEVEIGLGSSHDGIMVLPNDLPAGMPAAEYFNISSDAIIEVDITPNRVDATSHYGVARDLYAYLKSRGIEATLRYPEGKIEPTSEEPIKVTLDSPEACLRYSGIVIKGVKVGPSPEWLRQALESIDQKSINNIVDVTNYVLHELGQPLHAFDLGKIKGGIHVRLAREGEVLTTLDGVERKLTDRDLAICDDKRPLCLAGVMGGIDSGVSESTVDLFLESATFHPTFVRKSARRHTLSSDSSFRFERGLDAEATLKGLHRAAYLITEIAGGKVASCIYDIYPEPVGPYKIDLSFEKINQLIGIEIPEDKVRAILAALDIKIAKEEDGMMHLEVPRYRYDVTRDVDVIEDILRIYGYNEIPLTHKLSSTIAPAGSTDISIHLQQVISEQLVGAGFHEILNNSLSKESYYASSEDLQAKAVRLLNPLSGDLSTMRQTLLFGGLESLAFNLNRKASAIRMFEFGSCYERVDDSVKTPLKGYKETFRLGVWMTGDKTTGNWAEPSRVVSPFELKATLYNILSRLGLSPAELQYESADQDPYIANGEVISLRGGAEVIRWGIVDSKLTKQADIDCPVYFAEFDWGQIMGRIVGRKVTISPVAKFPSVKRDFALLIDKSVPFVEIEKVAYKTEKKLLKSVHLFDVYEDPRHLPEGKKSYAVSFELQDAEKTLSEGTIEKTMARLFEALHKELGAELR
ncbi:phenylalanine--tRNA ligase subunit beta [Porphyromonas sp.]|uniref:phenylalanine--tRNA ligase subunit beta n=1 Tax=Porphyromonas sp. TaxID=1924944 RepID=UPI0026DD5B5F|nr:phenylalanine--tRNA ligase subunit beta [Porphyromonas sp.]MDO4770737.1 phenylalanine--tRNA ligase subunit beta [Porphyromonas sp.]